MLKGGESPLLKGAAAAPDVWGKKRAPGRGGKDGRAGSDSVGGEASLPEPPEMLAMGGKSDSHRAWGARKLWVAPHEAFAVLPLRVLLQLEALPFPPKAKSFPVSVRDSIGGAKPWGSGHDYCLLLWYPPSSAGQRNSG